MHVSCLCHDCELICNFVYDVLHVLQQVPIPKPQNKLFVNAFQKDLNECFQQIHQIKWQNMWSDPSEQHKCFSDVMPLLWDHYWSRTWLVSCVTVSQSLCVAAHRVNNCILSVFSLSKDYCCSMKILPEERLWNIYSIRAHHIQYKLSKYVRFAKVKTRIHMTTFGDFFLHIYKYLHTTPHSNL